MKFNFDVLVVGAGAFGLSTAIALTKRNYKVAVLNPDAVPHHLAASTDISKIVRVEYGSDEEYCNMGAICIEGWKAWNTLLNEELYHEVGLTMFCAESLAHNKQRFENESLNYLKKHNYVHEVLDAKGITKRYPVIDHQNYKAAVVNPVGGYVESGRVIEKMARYARSIGVALFEQQTVHQFIQEHNTVIGVKTEEGDTFYGGHTVVAAGAYTPYLVPELQAYFKITGHPVFWLKPQNSKPFSAPNLPVFTADISNTGWYGFPVHPKYGVVKIGRHTNGLALHPDLDDRKIMESDIAQLKTFLKNTFPELAHAPLVYTRRCLYADTLDGHFWIDHHPELKNLSVSSGGSGHGFKMMPILGEITADMIEQKENVFGNRFKWRHLEENAPQLEEARYKKS